MRELWSWQKTLEFNPVSEETKGKVAALERVISALPRTVLDHIEADLTADVEHPETGRSGMSAGQVLRVALVKQMFGFAYRQLHFEIEDSNLIRRFTGYEYRHVPRKTALQSNIAAIRAETWEVINDALVRFARKEDIEDLEKVRIDTTAVEADIHYPTDATLLEDGVRVTVRLLQQAGRLFPEVEFDFHDRSRVCKKLSFRIKNAKKAEDRVKLYRELVAKAAETMDYGLGAAKALRAFEGRDLDERAVARALAEKIKAVCDLLRQVIDQTRRRVFLGEKVPSTEKIVSIFEPHTDIIEKGKRETEFGHKVCLSMGKHLILDAEILAGNPVDTEPFTDALRRIRKKFRQVPSAVVTDQGCGSSGNAQAAHTLGVESLWFCGKRLTEEAQDLVEQEPTLQRMLARFRAGAEGLISAAKRAGAGLKRCIWKGYDHFCSYVWSVICAFNLKEIARALC